MSRATALEKQISFLRAYAEYEVEPVSLKRAKFAAAVIYKGSIVAIGCNKNKTHPLAVKYAKNSKCETLHAEVDVIIKAQKKLSADELKKATLLIVRVKCKDFKRRKEAYVFGNAKPCEGCARCIADNKIGTVIYTNDCLDIDELSYSISKKI